METGWQLKIAKRGAAAALLSAAAAAASFAAEQAPFPAGRLVDLTHPFDESAVYWPTEKGFVLEKGFEGDTGKGYWYYANRFSAAEHGGTHIDAPAHFYKGRDTVDAVPLKRLMARAVVVDASRKCLAEPDYQVRTEDFNDWEKRNGRIPEGAIVLLRTGFGRFWPDRKRYMGTDERGEAGVAKLHFPGLHPEAAKWLVDERRIAAVGLDTPSIDHGQSKTFRTHVTLFERNVPAFENVANLDQLPETGLSVVALPMKIKRGSGGPLRIVAIVEEKAP